MNETPLCSCSQTVLFHAHMSSHVVSPLLWLSELLLLIKIYEEPAPAGLPAAMPRDQQNMPVPAMASPLPATVAAWVVSKPQAPEWLRPLGILTLGG